MPARAFVVSRGISLTLVIAGENNIHDRRRRYEYWSVAMLADKKLLTRQLVTQPARLNFSRPSSNITSRNYFPAASGFPSCRKIVSAQQEVARLPPVDIERSDDYFIERRDMPGISRKRR